MQALLSKLPLGTFVLGGICLVSMLLLWQQHNQLLAANQRLGELSQALTTVNNSITELTAAAEKNQQAQALLSKQLQQVTASNGKFQAQLQGLKHELQSVRDWANTELPTAIKQLQQRPAITGSAEYRAWLSTRYPVPTAAQQPNEQRISTAGQ